METIGSISGSISKAMFGESKPPTTEEPPSGETGKGTAAEPYDGGNAPEQEKVTSTQTPAPTSTLTDTPTTDTNNDTSKHEKRPSHSARMPSFTLKETATSSTNPDIEPTNASSDPPPSSETTTTDPTKKDQKEQQQTHLAADQARKHEAHEVKSPFDPSARRSSRSHDIDFESSPDRGVSPGQLPSGEHVPTGQKGEKLRRIGTGGSSLGGAGGLGDKLKSKFRFGGGK